MRSFIWLSLSCLLIAFSSFGQQNTGVSQAQMPNIIFILGDDIGYYIPTVNGGQSYSTPNIDSMARHGMNFTHCEASPLCNPSRFMFLTGKYNFRNYSNWGYMSDSEKTVANLMHDAGYVTGMFGKLQLQYKYARMQKWGWDRHMIFELIEDTVKFRRYKNPVLMENGYRIPDSVTNGKYCDDILTQSILDFIDSNKSRPFFVYYSMSIGHEPFSPTPDDPAFATWDPNQGVSAPVYFPSMVKYMDKKVGQILDKLRAAGLEGNTLVIYAGDNGTPVPIKFIANGITMQGEKGKTTEGGTHVPLILYWPGQIAEGGINDDLADFTDFLPTFAEVAKVADLSGYGTLDGASLFARINSHKNVKKQLFFHFDPFPGGYDTLQRWARNKNYKLYDSTGSSKSGKFFNVANDVYETSPIPDSLLTANQLSTKQTLKHILDTVGTWPACPRLTNQFATNITSSSAVIGATIADAGASPLIDRGSNITTAKDGPYLSMNRLHAATVAVGTFSQKRSGLSPQKLYKFDLYAMNKNLSHSTGFAYGQFYTLSNPPLMQPMSFTATTTNSGIELTWTDALFPKKGATKAGYILLYSSGTAEMSNVENGKPPASANGHFTQLASASLPQLPSNKITINSLSKDSAYYLVLIPYTWDGSNDCTFNYLTKNALSLRINGKVNNLATNATNDGLMHKDQSSDIHLFPNPVKDILHLTALSSSFKTIAITDEQGRLLTQTTTNVNSYSFNIKQLLPGTYFVTIDDSDKTTVLKFIKQ